MPMVGILVTVFSPFLAVLPVCFLLYRFWRQKNIENMEWKTYWPVGFLLLFLWSLFVAIMNMHSLSALASLAFLGFFGISIYVQNTFRTEKQAEELLRYVFLFTLGSAFFGILEHFYVINREPSWWKYIFGLCTVVENEENLLRITGTFGNPNLAATWYAVMILVGYYFWEKAQVYWKGFYFGALVVLIAVLIMTESRGGITGLFLGLIVYDFFSGKRGALFFRLGFILSALIFLFHYPQWFPRGSFFFSTMDLRGAIWQNCWNMFLIQPVTGWGLLGIYFADHNVYQYLRVLHAHNTLLSLATMLGLGGLLIFVRMEWGILKDILFLSRRKCCLLPLLTGVQAVFIGHGLCDFTLMGPQIGILFAGSSALVAGLACSLGAEGSLRDKNRLSQ